MKNNLKKAFYLLTIAVMGVTFTVTSAGAVHQGPLDPNDPGILHPQGFRIPHTDQADGNVPLNVVDGVVNYSDAEGSLSLLGNVITTANSPNDDMKKALANLSKAAEKGNDMTAAAQELMDILEGTTSGRIYDGFPMLNYNHNFPGEYKTKRLVDTGLTEPGVGGTRKIWEVDVAMFFYDGQIDADTFLVRVPKEAHPNDTFRVNYKIYSVEREEFAPTVVMAEAFPFKGFDSVWLPFNGGEIMEFTMALPPLRMIRGVYTWGWRVHPPRIQFLQPIFEVETTTNAYGDMVAGFNLDGPQLEPQGLSFAVRNRGLDLAGISDAAPEKKMYTVAQAALNGASAATVDAMLNDENISPSGTWDQWADLAKNQRQLPPEARDILDAEGIPNGEFGPYRMVSVYMNNEMYADGPAGPGIPGWNQGDQFSVKVINLDNHTHYFRNVDFGPRLHDDIANCCQAGSHSFEIMNFKPTYGAPKVAEMQWRAGWGFRPHHDAHPQPDVFPRASDQVLLQPYTNGAGDTFAGYQYSAGVRGGDFTFNPPPFIVGTNENPKPKLNGGAGLTIGRATEGYGIANMCTDAQVALDPPPFCPDIRHLHPTNAANFPPFAGFPNPTIVDGKPTFPATTHTALRFPPFLRNPDQAAGGDIIPPTPLWKPFLWISPNNGTLFINGVDDSDGYWADLTYSHGTPISAGGSLIANIEAPRGSAQVFYQFDDLFHDNAIFSPHPTFSTN
ncbi:MAG: hypothetical protein ACE5G9_08025 [Nitrospinales bacterium]